MTLKTRSIVSCYYADNEVNNDDTFLWVRIAFKRHGLTQRRHASFILGFLSS